MTDSNKKKVVWCISKYALPPRYGAQGRLFFLSEEFAKAGYDSYVITSSTNHLTKAMPRQIESVHVHKEGLTKAVFLKGFFVASSISSKRVLSWLVFEWKLLKLILRRKNRIERPDVVIVSSLSLITILNGYLAKRLFGCKLFFEVRDIWPLSAVSVTGFSRYNPFIILLRAIEKFAYRKADIIFSTLPNLSEHVANSIKKDFRFCFVPQGFSEEFLSKSEPLLEEYVERYIPKGKFIVGYIGNIAKAYNIPFIADSARSLIGKHDDVHFLIVGDGPEKEQLMKRYGDLPNLSFLPKVNKNCINDFLSYCDVATISMFPEEVYRFGLSPQKLVDYMYAAKPVLMSYTGYKTFVEEADCGITVGDDIKEYTDGILKLKQMPPEELKKMGERGKRFLLNNLSWTQIAQRYINYF